MTWPPNLTDLKADKSIEDTDTRDDVSLQQNLDAAVSFVERIRPRFNYLDDPTLYDSVPNPTPELVLGTLRLAGRWFQRKNSPDGLLALAELGNSRVPSFDTDIDRLLGIGRFGLPVFA